MDYRNVKRSLLGRLALQTLVERKGIDLRVVHMNVLYLVYELGKMQRFPATSNVHFLMAKIKRGADPKILKGLLEDLYKLEFVDFEQTGTIKRYRITVDGRNFLSEYEKSLRITRSDRRIFKTIK